ncbi:MAG TPA: T9SS type B sorting domain-containing protein, partial [Phaeodactylibacter sp.]|nr:T9SS type B sorting domain-containing protein [Phaeodactylibacter sp.]
VLTVTNQLNGCTATAEANVIENVNVPQNLELALVSPSCYGDSDGSIAILGVMGGTPPYLYSFDNQPFTSDTSFLYLAAGNYSLMVQDASGCDWSTTITLDNPDEVMVELGDDIYLELGETATLEPLTNIPNSELDTIIWTTMDSLECMNCLDQEIAPLQSMGYSILLMNENGCITEDHITVYVNNKRRIFIPNVFSPNGDGVNDVFMIFGGRGVKEIEDFQIFSRWGDLVFEKHHFQPNDASMGWNGYFKGKKMNSAVFVFFAKIKYVNGETEIVKGDLVLK